LVGNMHKRVLGEYDVEGSIAKRQRAWTAVHEIRAVGESALCGARSRSGDHRGLDVEAGHLTRVVRVDQVQRDTARAAAQVEHMPARKIEPGNDAVDLFRTTWREIAFTPQRLQEADRRVVIFGFLACASAHLGPKLPSQTAQNLAHQRENATL